MSKKLPTPLNKDIRLFENIAIANDHAAIELKKLIVQHTQFSDYNWIDFGTNHKKSVDYPDYAELVVNAINSKQADVGICLCGTGIGMSMVANRHSSIRAALVWNKKTAIASREHNNANILCAGARVLDHQLACELVGLFLTTPFGGGRHAQRISLFSD